jgi:hypothetical protein
MEVDWSSMQNGLAGEAISLPQRHAPGTMQLDSFTNSNITSRPPPTLAFEDNGPEPLPEAVQDDEDRMTPDEWPDLDEYIHADLDEPGSQPPAKAPPQEEDAMLAFMGKEPKGKHAAAMELAPSKNPTISLEDAFEPVAEDSPVEPETIPQEEQAALVRIRVLMTSPEPILTASGESLELEAGDVHFVDQDSADWLIESGVAEAAAL